MTDVLILLIIIGGVVIMEAISLYMKYRSAKRLADELIDDIIVAMHVSDDLNALEEKEKENNSKLVTPN